MAFALRLGSTSVSKAVLALCAGVSLAVSFMDEVKAQGVETTTTGAEKPVSAKPTHPPARTVRHKPVGTGTKATQKAPEAKTAQQQPTAAPAPIPMAPAPAGPMPDFAAALVKGGASTCAAQVNTLASTTMAGVVASNTASHWATTAPERRAVNVFIGQKFGNAGVPYGAAGIFATPNGQGGCDGMAVQVIPSPISCAKIHDALAARGKQIGDLAGIPLMEDASGQTMLVPTSAGTCVLVGIRSAYVN